MLLDTLNDRRQDIIRLAEAHGATDVRVFGSVVHGEEHAGSDVHIEELEAGHPDTSWKNTSGFRNILVHNYLGEIDSATVKDVADTQLKPL